MLAEQLSAEHSHQNEPKIADEHRPPGFLMIVGAILDTFGAILGDVWCILALSWEDLGATWVHLGACKSKLKKPYFVERCDAASIPDLVTNPMCYQ